MESPVKEKRAVPYVCRRSEAWPERHFQGSVNYRHRELDVYGINGNPRNRHRYVDLSTNEPPHRINYIYYEKEFLPWLHSSKWKIDDLRAQCSINPHRMCVATPTLSRLKSAVLRKRSRHNFAIVHCRGM